MFNFLKINTKQYGVHSHMNTLHMNVYIHIIFKNLEGMLIKLFKHLIYVIIGKEINGFIHNQKENVRREHYVNILMAGMNINIIPINMIIILQKIHLTAVNKNINISNHKILSLLQMNQILMKYLMLKSKQMNINNFL